MSFEWDGLKIFHVIIILAVPIIIQKTADIWRIMDCPSSRNCL
jgi:hypothetical protein